MPTTDTRRTLIAGSPRAGKSTLAADTALGRLLLHTDDLAISHAWSEQSAAAAAWLNLPAPWVIEGVRIPHALRKWLALHPDGTPCDELFWLDSPRLPLTTRQEGMRKASRTVLEQCLPELKRRGVILTGIPGTPKPPTPGIPSSKSPERPRKPHR